MICLKLQFAFVYTVIDILHFTTTSYSNDIITYISIKCTRRRGYTHSLDGIFELEKFLYHMLNTHLCDSSLLSDAIFYRIHSSHDQLQVERLNSNPLFPYLKHQVHVHLCERCQYNHFLVGWPSYLVNIYKKRY